MQIHYKRRCFICQSRDHFLCCFKKFSCFTEKDLLTCFANQRDSPLQQSEDDPEGGFTLRDYHLHLEKGEYKQEYLKEFVVAGGKRGVTELGISEHTHHFKEFQEIYFRNVIMDDSAIGRYQESWLKQGPKSFCYTLDQYVSLIEAGKKAGLSLKLGLEVCYFPGEEQNIRRILKQYPFDYCIGSVHWLHGWGFDTKAELWQGKEVNEVYSSYKEVLLQAIQSDLFDIIGHPFSCKVFRHWPQGIEMNPWYVEIAAALLQHNTAMEINTGLLYRYPAATICPPLGLLQAAADADCQISFGSDAHISSDAGRALGYAMQVAKEVRITQQMNFEHRKGCRVLLDPLPVSTL